MEDKEPLIDESDSAEARLAVKMIELREKQAKENTERYTKDLYAVATTLTRDVLDSVNVQSVLKITEAVSREEAIGIAHEDATKRFPEHQIFTTMCVKIDRR